MRLIPAPRGTGIVAAKAPKKVLTMAGIQDCYTRATGSRKTMGNFIKATYYAIAKTYAYLTPDLWAPTVFLKSPYQEHTDWLKEAGDKYKAAKKLE
jgi:small subunit ribosomal protein S2e